MDTPLKKCSKCGEEKPATLEYFSKDGNKKTGLRASCKVCESKRFSDYYNRNRERNNERSRHWQRVNRERLLDRQREYRTVNRERMNELTRQWHAANQTHEKEYRRRYSAESRDKIKAAKQQHYLRNRDKINRQRRQWYARNREKSAEYSRQYMQTSRGKAVYRASRHRRRARKNNLPDTWTTQHWQLALEYFNHSCAVCGRQIDLFTILHADHWIPLSRPDCPGTVPENMIPLCSNKQVIDGQEAGCNQSKGAKLPEEWLTQQYGEKKAGEILDRIRAFFDWITAQQ